MILYADEVEKWGITQEFINNLIMQYNQANFNEQKKNILKANARQLTAAQNQLMKELESHCAMAEELVIYELPKEAWPEFGIRKGKYVAKGAAKKINQRGV